MRKQILGSLHYPSSYLPINRGYWKPNLSWHVYYMKGSNSSVGEVTQMFPKNLDSESVIPQTIIFVDERGLAFRMMDVLREFLPEGLRSQVEVYHALQSQVAKDLTAKRFEKGEIRILICTEALTMMPREGTQLGARGATSRTSDK
ncbi:ATP-dependent DNA helicase sgs1 [Ceratobasidium sp. 428]|nr:ATP-dependent DNA helicase sgs1 [Ceratobasidium sp. 428]